MPVGKIRFYSEARGFGFIRSVESGDVPDLFFHIDHVDDDLPEKVLGARVGFDIAKNTSASARSGDPSRATMAVNVRFIP